MRIPRAGRLAACTALALSAGMLLSGTATADAKPAAPHATTESARPAAAKPSAALPKHRVRASALAAAHPAKPRLDLNKDGVTDLLYRGLDSKTYLETWKEKENAEFANSFGTYKDLITPGDLDGNGSPELLTLGADGTLSLYADVSNNGASYPTWSGGGWNAYNKVVGAADLTGDGKGDVLARTPGGDLYLYPGTGTAHGDPFGSRIKVGGGWEAYDQIVGANDMNGDGFGDVVARTPGGDLYFYAGTGDASAPFKPRVRIGGGWDAYNQLMSIDDGNGDGYADLVARSNSGTLYFYASDGKGNFASPQEMGTNWQETQAFSGSGANPTPGKNGIIGRDNRGTLYHYYTVYNGQLSPRVQSSPTGDFADADHIAFAASLSGSIYGDVLQWDSGHLYIGSAQNDAGGGWGQYNTLVGAGDLNNDGKNDLLARDGSGTLYLYRGYGNGYQFAQRIRIGGGWNAYDKIVGAGDINGDGLADIVARTRDGRLYLYPGTGNSSAPFASRVYIGGGWDQFKNIAAPGDINGDGRADLVATNSRGEAFRYVSNGYGGFKSRVKLGDGWNTYRDLY
ncbi:VCBS repeat-containing protein [Streptomyces sp. CBMA152]|uniref:VCBS repeat-containing protein n=1 Tax=Streptomyces sp. CBMA152 TaxID=1896312 RepID=UPI002948BA8E|nr:VCBS repeat-containing protein [Streptomyces sp. CBMA152]